MGLAFLKSHRVEKHHLFKIKKIAKQTTVKKSLTVRSAGSPQFQSQIHNEIRSDGVARLPEWFNFGLQTHLYHGRENKTVSAASTKPMEWTSPSTLLMSHFSNDLTATSDSASVTAPPSPPYPNTLFRGETVFNTDNKKSSPVHRSLPLLLQPVHHILGKEDFVFDFATVSQSNYLLSVTPLRSIWVGDP